VSGRADVFNGGSGRDTASYAGRTTAVRVFLDRLSNDGAFGEGNNLGGLANDVEIVELRRPPTPPAVKSTNGVHLDSTLRPRPADSCHLYCR
jgi:hypothetical protein